MSVLDGPEGETTCYSPAVANSLSAPGETLQVGDSLNFTCVDGFQLDGAQQITCGADGQWQPLPPRCLPTYVPTRVPDKECEFVFLQFSFFPTSSFLVQWNFCLISSSVQGPTGRQKLQHGWQIRHSEKLCFWGPGPVRVWRRIHPSWREQIPQVCGRKVDAAAPSMWTYGSFFPPMIFQTTMIFLISHTGNLNVAHLSVCFDLSPSLFDARGMTR